MVALLVLAPGSVLLLILGIVGAVQSYTRSKARKLQGGDEPMGVDDLPPALVLAQRLCMALAAIAVLVALL
jgi:hypothetical protein